MTRRPSHYEYEERRNARIRELREQREGPELCRHALAGTAMKSRDILTIYIKRDFKGHYFRSRKRY